MFSINQIQIRQSVVRRWRGRKGLCAIRFLVNASDLQLECAKGLHESFLWLVLWYGSEIMIWMEN